MTRWPSKKKPESEVNELINRTDRSGKKTQTRRKDNTCEDNVQTHFHCMGLAA